MSSSCAQTASLELENRKGIKKRARTTRGDFKSLTHLSQCLGDGQKKGELKGQMGEGEVRLKLMDNVGLRTKG